MSNKELHISSRQTGKDLFLVSVDLAGVVGEVAKQDGTWYYRPRNTDIILGSKSMNRITKLLEYLNDNEDY